MGLEIVSVRVRPSIFPRYFTGSVNTAGAPPSLSTTVPVVGLKLQTMTLLTTHA